MPNPRDHHLSMPGGFILKGALPTLQHNQRHRVAQQQQLAFLFPLALARRSQSAQKLVQKSSTKLLVKLLASRRDPRGPNPDLVLQALITPL